MKIKYITPILAISILLLGGCTQKQNSKSTSVDTATIKEKLSTSIKDNNFSRALGLSESLNAIKSTGKNKAEIKQLKELVSAENSYSKQHFSAVLSSLKKAAKFNQDADNKSLRVTIADLRNKTNNVIKQSDELQHHLDLASNSLAQNKYAEAMISTNLVLQKQYDTKEYGALYKQALKLKIEILNAQMQNNGSVANGTKETNSSNQQSSKTVGNDEPGDTSSSTSSSAISANDIKQARADLKAAGEDPTFWSDGDIETAITNARKDGRTHIKSSDLH